MDYASIYNQFAVKYIGRTLTSQDAEDEVSISQVEKNLHLHLPLALRTYYKVAGKAEDMNRIHNEFCNIEDLTVEDDYLIFMHENQSVVSWGIPLSSLKEENPAVWQRNNKSRQWYPEGESFTAVMESMFAWYSKMGLWNTA